MLKPNKFLTVVLVILIICLVILVPVLYLGYNYMVNRKIQLVEVPYANQTIQPGIKIGPKMVSKMGVPKSFLVGNYYGSVESIIGKCTPDDSIIVDGSLFYEDLLVDCNELEG